MKSEDCRCDDVGTTKGMGDVHQPSTCHVEGVCGAGHRWVECRAVNCMSCHLPRSFIPPRLDHNATPMERGHGALGLGGPALVGDFGA